MIQTDSSTAVGVPVFKRTEALRRCLNSVPDAVVDRVIIADNGRSENREQLYNRDWAFELTVLELEYNSGIGACRAAIADELAEDYLIVVDNDMILPSASELIQLQTAVEYDSLLGGVSGILAERNRIRSGCSNLHEETSLFGNVLLVHSIRDDVEIERIKPTLHIARFDKLTNAAILRQDCIEDYSWDRRYPMGEHLDFYLGHYHRTDWEFAVCPTVVFDHQKGRYPTYREEIRGSGTHYNRMQSTVKQLNSKKWGYERIVYGSRPDWIDTSESSIVEQGYRNLSRHIPLRYILPIRDVVDSLV